MAVSNYCLSLLFLVVDKQYEECHRISCAVAAGLWHTEKKVWSCNVNSCRTELIHADYCRLCSDTINSWCVGIPLYYQRPIDLKLYSCSKSQTVCKFLLCLLFYFCHTLIFSKRLLLFLCSFLAGNFYFVLDF